MSTKVILNLVAIQNHIVKKTRIASNDHHNPMEKIVNVSQDSRV
jgi:hypothetical protein